MGNNETFCLLLTENCNFACTYCYERAGKGHNGKNMTKEVANDTLEYAFGLEEVSGVSLSLFGGEPTLNPDVIDFLCVRGKELSKETGKPYQISMISNGSLMTEKLYNIISRNLDIMVDLQLSVDGMAKTQDLTRIGKDGKGTFERVESGIPYWKALFPMVSVHGVLSEDNMHNLFENYKFFYEEWGIRRLWFLPAKDKRYTQASVDTYDQQMGLLTEYIMTKVRGDRNLDHIREYQPLDKALFPTHASPKPCGMGDSYRVITCDGGIWPCHHLYFIDDEDETKMGDIYSGVPASKDKIWKEYDNTDMTGCGGCDHTDCFRCPAENYEEFGTPFTQITGIWCDFMKVDLKYQRQVKQELIEMGLMSDDKKKVSGCGDGACENCGTENAECTTVTGVRSYGDVSVGKTGCDVVENTLVDVPTDIKQKLDAVPVGSDAPIMKDILNDIIGILVTYHNKL